MSNRTLIKQTSNFTRSGNNIKYDRVTDTDNSKDPFRILAEIVENDRRRILDVTPDANTDISAFIIHVEEVTAFNSSVTQNVDEIGPAWGYFRDAPMTENTTWYKAYGYVDFYSSCLPFPKTTLMNQEVQKRLASMKSRTQIDVNALLKAFDGDLHSILRISRFPYFLVPKSQIGPGMIAGPEPGRPARVKFIDTDNYSYGVFLGSYSLKETTVGGEKVKLAPTPLIAPGGDAEKIRREIDNNTFDKSTEQAKQVKRDLSAKKSTPIPKTMTEQERIFADAMNSRTDTTPPVEGASLGLRGTGGPSGAFGKLDLSSNSDRAMREALGSVDKPERAPQRPRSTG